MCKIIYNRVIPFKGFKAINLFGIIFARKGSDISEQTIRHEKIHTRQMLELLVVGFYIWYIIEWLIKWAIYRDWFVAYRNISFEREAYLNDKNVKYLKTRRLFTFLNYLK